MRTPVMTRKELLVESGLSAGRLAALERRLGLRRGRRRDGLVTLGAGLRILRAAEALRRKA